MMLSEHDGAFAHLPSGIAGLDEVLRGGLLTGGIYLIQGAPGSGKTILSNQIAFNHVAGGGQALYVTLLAETHARMLLHLRSFRFFDQGKVGSAITYLSAFKALEDEGLPGLLQLVGREIRRLKCGVVILDGFVAAGERAESNIEFKKFIQGLQAVAGLTRCTFLLLTSGRGERVGAEHTMVDGLLLLRDDPHGAARERIIEVTKFRGADAIRGEHAFRITDSGIIVFPRVEGILARPAPTGEISDRRLSTGIADLDKMIMGGPPVASTMLLLGPSGAGKTSMGLHFLSQANAKEPGLMFGFFETPDRLVHKARHLGLDLVGPAKRRHLEFVWQPGTENLLDELGHRLLDAVKKTNAKRVFIDGLQTFMDIAHRPERISHFFTAVTNEFRVRGVTSVYTLEAANPISLEVRLPIQNISSVAENIILLRFVEWKARLHRVLSVLKMRDSDHDKRLREFIISDRGITLATAFTSAEQVMSGFARERRAPVASSRKKSGSARTR